jgi:AbrB family looped-hinge helix DNA binding protein
MLINIQELLGSMEAGVTTYTTVKVSKRYQIAVPALARQLLKINSGDRLLVDIQDGILILMPEPKNYTDTIAGLHKHIWEGVGGQEYIAEERDAWAGSSNG